MNCVEVVELVSDWIEGVLDDDRTVALEMHLRVCGDCTVFVDQIRVTLRALGSMDEPPLTPAFRERLVLLFTESSRE